FLDRDEKLWLMWYPVIANQWETSIPMYRTSTNYEKRGAPEWDWQEVLFVKPGDRTERGIQPGDRFVAAVAEQLTAYEQYLDETLMQDIPDSLHAYFRVEWSKYKHKLDSLSKGRNMIRSGRIREGEKE